MKNIAHNTLPRLLFPHFIAYPGSISVSEDREISHSLIATKESMIQTVANLTSCLFTNISVFDHTNSSEVTSLARM